VNAQIEYLLKEATRKAGRWKEEKRENFSNQHPTEPELEKTSGDATKTDQE
jgi:hypothetical protein